MAAVIEKTGYVALATRERERNVISLRSALIDVSNSMKFVLGALAAQIGVAAGTMTLIESAAFVSLLVMAVLFCYVTGPMTRPSHLKLYGIGMAVALGGIGGVLLKGALVFSPDSLQVLQSVPLALLTFGGILAVTKLGRYITSD
jgi:hypothetical protein